MRDPHNIPADFWLVWEKVCRVLGEGFDSLAEFVRNDVQGGVIHQLLHIDPFTLFVIGVVCLGISGIIRQFSR